MKEGWTNVRLGDLCKIQSGNSNTKDAVPNGKYIFFDRSRTPKRSDRYLFDCEALIIAGEGAEFRPKKVNGKFDLHQRAYAIYGFGNLLLGDYLYFYLEHVHSYFQDVAVGATVKSLRQRHFENLPVLVPPLDEQKRIVSILDQAFAALDHARENAEANLADAEILEEQGAERLLKKISASAPKKLLGEIAEFRNGLNFSRHSKGESIKIAGVGDFKNHFSLPIDSLKFTNIEGHLSSIDRLSPGDILTVRSNGNKDLIGRVVLVGETDEKISFSGFVIRIRLKSPDIKPDYLCYVMKSVDSVAHLRAGGGGANISNLNQGILSGLLVSVPSVEKQNQFVNLIGALNTKVGRLRKQTTSQISDIADLRQSLLQKAFSGQLT